MKTTSLFAQDNEQTFAGNKFLCIYFIIYMYLCMNMYVYVCLCMNVCLYRKSRTVYREGFWSGQVVSAKINSLFLNSVFKFHEQAQMLSLPACSWCVLPNMKPSINLSTAQTFFQLKNVTWFGTLLTATWFGIMKCQSQNACKTLSTRDVEMTLKCLPADVYCKDGQSLPTGVSIKRNNVLATG